jgi:hypothetical protein
VEEHQILFTLGAGHLVHAGIFHAQTGEEIKIVCEGVTRVEGSDKGAINTDRSFAEALESAGEVGCARFAPDYRAHLQREIGIGKNSMSNMRFC